VLRVVPGTIAHTKEVTGVTRLNERRGPVELQASPARVDEGELRSAKRCLGTGHDWVKAATGMENYMAIQQ
jgi:hypothetical protein